MNHLSRFAPKLVTRLVPAGLIALVTLASCERVSDRAIEQVQIADVYEASKTNGNSYLILDARDANAFKSGHIPGAKRMVAADIDALNPDPKLKTYKAIYVYGEHPNHNAAKALVKRIMIAKAGDVYLMDEGYLGWTTQGNPVQAKP
ncbi:MAG: rhodanese-like domain-containing protein [Phycisphaerales bacterium]